MELRALEYFVAVVDEGGFTRAARRLRVAQPGVSAQVRGLEREVGQPLLERRPRGVVLTAAGEAALPHARAALAAAEAVRTSVAELTGLLRGTLRVGVLRSSSGTGVAELLRRFHEQAPEVDVRVSEDDSTGLLASVRDGSLDVAWVATPDADLPGLTGFTVGRDALSAVVARGHRWSRRRTVALAELVTEGLVAVPRGAGIRTLLDDACSAAGLTPRIDVEASSPVLLVSLAAQGLGVAVVPASLAASLSTVPPATSPPGASPDVRVLRIVRPELVSRVQVVWRTSGLSPAAHAFSRSVRAAHGPR